MDLFFIAGAIELDNCAKKYIHDLESYITFRRDTSGCKFCFVLIEYAAQIDLPDEVTSHPIMMATEDAANDHISWSNVTPYTIEHCAPADISPDRIFSLTTWSNLAMKHTI
jgi:hypothetical protein